MQIVNIHCDICGDAEAVIVKEDQIKCLTCGKLGYLGSERTLPVPNSIPSNSSIGEE